MRALSQFITIDWIQFLPALALLLIPIDAFRPKRARYRGLMSDWSGYWSRILSYPAHTIDFVRAGIGAWLLLHAVAAAPDAHGALRYAPAILQTGVLLIGTSLQTLVCKELDAANAPFAYAIGLTLGFLPPLIAGFALVLAIVTAVGAHTPASFFPMLSVSVVGLGILFTKKKLLLVLPPVAVAVMMPFLLTLLFPRHFVSSYLGKPVSKEDPVLPPHR